jgi:hypothetical protein
MRCSVFAVVVLVTLAALAVSAEIQVVRESDGTWRKALVGEGGERRLVVALFMRNDCPHCGAIEDILEDLDVEMHHDGNNVLQFVEVETDKNIVLADSYAIDRTPTLITICGPVARELTLSAPHKRYPHQAPATMAAIRKFVVTQRDACLGIKRSADL